MPASRKPPAPGTFGWPTRPVWTDPAPGRASERDNLPVQAPGKAAEERPAQADPFTPLPLGRPVRTMQRPAGEEAVRPVRPVRPAEARSVVRPPGMAIRGLDAVIFLMVMILVFGILGGLLARLI